VQDKGALISIQALKAFASVGQAHTFPVNGVRAAKSRSVVPDLDQDVMIMHEVIQATEREGLQVTTVYAMHQGPTPWTKVVDLVQKAMNPGPEHADQGQAVTTPEPAAPEPNSAALKPDPAVAEPEPVAMKPESAVSKSEAATLKPELTSFQTLIGKWNCSGQLANHGPIRSTIVFSPDLDGGWLRARHEDAPPNRYLSAEMWGYDKDAGSFIAVIHDNFGGARLFTSPGLFQLVPTLKQARE
jgi:hypothetical protein